MIELHEPREINPRRIAREQFVREGIDVVIRNWHSHQSITGQKTLTERLVGYCHPIRECSSGSSLGPESGPTIQMIGVTSSEANFRKSQGKKSVVWLASTRFQPVPLETAQTSPFYIGENFEKTARGPLGRVPSPLRSR